MAKEDLPVLAGQGVERLPYGLGVHLEHDELIMALYGQQSAAFLPASGRAISYDLEKGRSLF